MSFFAFLCVLYVALVIVSLFLDDPRLYNTLVGFLGKARNKIQERKKRSNL